MSVSVPSHMDAREVRAIERVQGPIGARAHVARLSLRQRTLDEWTDDHPTLARARRRVGADRD